LNRDNTDDDLDALPKETAYLVFSLVESDANCFEEYLLVSKRRHAIKLNWNAKHRQFFSLDEKNNFIDIQVYNVPDRGIGWFEIRHDGMVMMILDIYHSGTIESAGISRYVDVHFQ